MTSSHRGKWHHQFQLPPSQTPRILNLPRRSRSSRTTTTGSRVMMMKPDKHLVSLFELEKRVRAAESAPVSPPRRSEHVQCGCGDEEEDSGEEKWRFQAEMLRAECNFLRMEREVAVRKLDRQRGQVECALRSAVETLVSGRKKIDGGGELDEEIRDLEEMLEEVQMENKDQGGGGGGGGRQSFRQLQRCRGRNFDRQASNLRRRLEKMPVSNEEVSVKEIREITLPVMHRQERSATPDHNRDENTQMSDVEVLKRKMEGLSKGMVERMVEYGFMPQYCKQQQQQQQGKAEEIGKKGADIGSGCECREIVGKIMEQVKVESEQWTEMQAMLDQVRQEMVELQSSRDLWQRRAIASDVNVRSLHAQVLEWKHRARVSENNVEELEKRVSELQNRLHSMKIEHLAHKTSQENIEACKSNMKLSSQWQIPLSDYKRENEKQMMLADHRRENEKQMTLADHRRESEKQKSSVDHRRENEKKSALTDERRESDKQMLLADYKRENKKLMTLADHWRENDKQIVLPNHRRDNNERHNLVRRLKKSPSLKTRRAPFTEVSNFLKQ